MKTRVVVGFIFKGGKLILIKHKDKNMWLPAGGHVEAREIKEELNIKVKILGEPFFIMEEPDEITAHFVCSYESGDIKMDESELLNWKLFSREEIENFPLDGKIKELSLEAFDIFNKTK